MTETCSANLEMTIVLPLGVLANQLMRIEADLRLLNMKTLDLAKGRANERHTGLIEARLENINETIDAIRGLVSDMQADLQPRSRDVTRTSTKDHISQIERYLPVDDTRLSADIVHSELSNRKPNLDQDD